MLLGGVALGEPEALQLGDEESCDAPRSSAPLRMRLLAVSLIRRYAPSPLKLMPPMR